MMRVEPEPGTPQGRVERVAYRPRDIVAATGIVKTTVYAAIKSGELRAVKTGPRALVVPAEALRAWLASLPPAAGQ